MDTTTIIIACIVALAVLIIFIALITFRDPQYSSDWDSSGHNKWDGWRYREKIDKRIREEDVSPEPPLHLLRLDAAVPDKVQSNRAFDLAVTVRQASSPVLSADDLPIVKSGDVQVLWPNTQSFVRLRVQASAPDCEIYGEDSHSFRLYLGQDSPVFYFHLTPKKPGLISVIVKVYQEQDWLGSTRVHTISYEQIVGSIQLEITSHKMRPDTRSPMDLSEDIYSIKPQIIYLSRRLQKLREIQAVKGIDTEPHYLVEIEDIEEKLSELQEQIRKTKPKSE